MASIVAGANGTGASPVARAGSLWVPHDRAAARVMALRRMLHVLIGTPSFLLLGYAVILLVKTVGVIVLMN
ncbi:hypothetical protein D3C76_1337080 [compost metagenome]